MLDKEDLLALRELIDGSIMASERRIDKKLEAMEQRTEQKLEAMEQRTDKKLEAMEQRIAKNTVTLMDAEFSKRFDTLAEGQEIILEKLVPRSRVDDLEDEIKFLKVIVRQMNEDLQKLKKAN